MALAKLSIYYAWKNTKSECSSNKLKISALTWNDTFDLPDGSYSISDIKDYFEFIIKNTSFSIKMHQFKFTQIKSKAELFSK